MRRLMLVFFVFAFAACGDIDSTLKQDSVDLVVADPGATGTYTVKSYQPTGTNAGYQSIIIYYPSNLTTSLLPATTLSGGYTNTKESMSWLGQLLASHGIVTAVYTPTNTNTTDATVWSNGHKAAYQTLINESNKTGVPIAGRIDSTRIGLMGYSMGGAGTILASNALGSKIKAIVTFCAYNPTTPTNGVPSLFITGNNDTVASPASVLAAFNNLKTSQPKAFAKFAPLSHLDIPNGGRNHAILSRYTVAWAQVFLANNPAYSTYLNGDELKKQTSNASIFAKATDYIYK